MRRRNFLNVRSQLEYAATLFEGLQKHGMCPAITSEIPKFLLLNRAILRQADARRAKGNRKDLYITKERS